MTTVSPTDYATLSTVGLYVVDVVDPVVQFDRNGVAKTFPFVLVEVTEKGIPVQIGFQTEAERTALIPVKYAALAKVN